MNNKPKYSAYWSLGEGKGIRIAVWDTHVQLTRIERDNNGNWITKQEISLARPILEKLFIRLPKIFDLMIGE